MAAIQPIVLNAEGETLIPDFGDEEPIHNDGPVGNHGMCGGEMFLQQVSKTHHVLVCRPVYQLRRDNGGAGPHPPALPKHCSLRVHVPNDATSTREKLRQYFKELPWIKGRVLGR